MATTKKPIKKAAKKAAPKKATAKRVVKDPSDLLCIAMVQDPEGGLHTNITASADQLKRAIGILTRVFIERFTTNAKATKSRRKIS